jgi:WD40 repeat protein/predicted Ser/Thr protein kinase
MLGTFTPCTECGAPIRGSAGLGLCSRCLLASAMSGRGDDALKSGSPEEEADPAPLRRAGDYELLEEIARGGMGVVYKARQRSLGRVVALKVLLGGAFAGEAGRRRLRSEAAAAGRLRHPNIVAIHEAGEIDGQPFYSMEFVAGRTLADLVRGGPLPASRAAAYVATVARAVDHAHHHGILHRDLKPSNVLIDAADQPHVADFGLAKEHSVEGTPEIGDRLTLTGQVLGSPAYMSPEQARGGEVGPATDVYSLGAVLYELITGVPPFQAESPQAVLELLRTEDPAPPRRLNRGVPPDLETLCLRCLEKEASRRYPTALELAEDLERFLRHEPVRARPVGWSGRTLRWARRHPVVALLATLLALAVLTTGGVIVTSAARVRASRDEARDRLAESLVSEARALRLAGEAGHREQALSRLAEARRLDPGGRLKTGRRDETIAALARSDLRSVTLTNLPPSRDLMLMAFDPGFTVCALPDEANNAVTVHRVPDGTLIARVPAKHPDEVLGFSRDATFLATRHRAAIGLWHVATGREVLPTAGGEGTVLPAGAISPDGRLLGRGEKGLRFAVYALTGPDAASGRIERVADWPLPGGLRLVMAAWSPDGRAVALVMENETIAVCDAMTGEVRWQQKQTEGILGLAWSRARDVIAFPTPRDTVVLLNAADGQEVRWIDAPTDANWALGFSHEGSLLAVGGERLGTRVFDAWTGRLLGVDRHGTWHLQFDLSDTRVGLLYDRGFPAWLEWMPSTVVRSLRAGASPEGHQVLRFSPDGKTLMALSGEGVILWNLARGERSAVIPVRPVLGAAFDGEGRRLLMSTRTALLEIDLDPAQSGGLARQGQEPRRIVSGVRHWTVATSRRGGRVAVADHGENLVRVLGPRPGEEREFKLNRFSGFTDLAPDGRWLVAGGATAATVWDLESPEAPPRTLQGEGEGVRFSPDGQWLIMMGRDLRLWRTQTWEPHPAPLPIERNTAVEYAAAISADGRWLAVNQNDREIHLIDLATRRTLASLEGPGTSRILDVCFSPDDAWLAAARDRGEVQVWDLKRLRSELVSVDLDW